MVHSSTTSPDATAAIPAQSVGRTPELPLRESTEVQGDILAGFRKDQVVLLFLSFGEQRQARRWLDRVRHRVAHTRDVAAFNAAFSRARRARGGDPVQAAALWRGLGLTYPGLVKLVGASPIADVPQGTTSEAFVQGSAQRAELLGDTGPSHPSRWLFGGGNNPPIHAVLTLAADQAGDLRQALEEERAELARHRLTVVFEQIGGAREGDSRGHEHFGFKDGVSQPAVRGFDQPDPDRPEHQWGKPGTRIIASGEFLVGHEKDHRFADGLPAWMMDGSFQVVRRLAQDVAGWWAQVEELLTELKERGGIPESATAEWLAARLVGRWPSGTPVATCPYADHPDGGKPGKENDFGFVDDIDGWVTPLFSHLRKTNPRDGLRARESDRELIPQAGALDGRRLMRRGTPYGRSYVPGGSGAEGPQAPRGLIFVSYQSDLVAQFEFVQRSWIDADDFPQRGARVGRDGMIGQESTVSFPVGDADSPKSVAVGLRRYVRTEGAVYTFVPSLSALRQLAEGTVPPGGGPLQDQVLTAPIDLRRSEVISSGKARLRMQEDGNLTVRDESEELRWQSGTSDAQVAFASFLTTGELVLLSPDGQTVWSTPTGGNPGATLVVQTDGDVVIRSADGEVLWHTDTAH